MAVKQRTFAMDLTPDGTKSAVLLDGDDITGLLRGVAVRSAIGEGTTVELHVCAGVAVQLQARLPEARVVLLDGHGADAIVRRLRPWLAHLASCSRASDDKPRFDSPSCDCGLVLVLRDLQRGFS